jgi:hypothetical protein
VDDLANRDELAVPDVDWLGSSTGRRRRLEKVGGGVGHGWPGGGSVTDEATAREGKAHRNTNQTTASADVF